MRNLIDLVTKSLGILVLCLFGSPIHAQTALPYQVLAGPFTGTSTQQGRVFRNGNADPVCPTGYSDPYPGVFNTGSTYNYESVAYTYNGPAQCVTVNIQVNGLSNSCGTNAHLSVYENSYDPANQETNFLATSGSSIDASIALNLTPGQSLVFVVTNTGSQSTCDFNVTSDHDFSTQPPDAPTGLIATSGDGQVSVAFTAPASDGGASITDYEYQLDGGAWVSAATTTSPVVITGLSNGTGYSIKLRAMNAAGPGAPSLAVLVTTPSPASEFAAKEAAIRDVIVDEAVRSLQSTLATNQRMTHDARERFIAAQNNEDAGTAQTDVPFDVTGNLEVSGATLSSKGTFFGTQTTGNGTRRIVLGDFDVQHDGETGSNTATLTGRVAWERMISDKTLAGYFVGGELAHSNIAGAFAGDQSRLGVTVGGYAVHELAEKTYLEVFLTFGAGRNNLDMADDVLALESDYMTKSVTFGGALSGVFVQKGYEIWPELSFSYGRTWIGDVGFTGRAYGLVDDTLSLDAGTVTLANIIFRPEFRVPLDGLSGADSKQLVTFAPRLICVQTKTTVTEKDCGGGAELGFIGHFGDGLSMISAKISADRVRDNTRSSLQLNLEHRF